MSGTVAAIELLANGSGYPKDGLEVGQDEGVSIDLDHEAPFVPL